MSSNSVSFNNQQQAQVNTNLAKLFPFEKEMLPYQYTNSTYDDVTIPAGTVMGVVAATGEIVPLESEASDGSQYPVGILARDYVVTAGESKMLWIVVKGWVRRDMILLQNDDTLETVIEDRRIFERIMGDTLGIFIQTTVSCTNYENQLV